MENKSTRAQSMAELYGKKLEIISGVKLVPIQLGQDENKSPEVLEKHRLAKEKLASFKDLLG